MTELATPTTRVEVEHECRIFSEHLGAIYVVHVQGHLDWATAAQFRECMRDSYLDATVIIDLSRTVRMDSAGTGVLVSAAAETASRGQQLVVVSADPVEVDVLRSLQLDLVVPIFASQAEALAWLGDHAPKPA
jgi:anti-anti-sigma factor